ncbi:MAG TPA: hypothetical protein VLU43_13110 [Anaeromyxobacteraceae bacterium]|nr:hypothetical protein [Anaeromyxobacteraceae bacterium]
MALEIGSTDGEVTLRVGASFLPEDASRIHELVERSPPGTHVEIDFRRVRDCHDAALSQLARDIVAARVVIALHGTSQHQERVLRYLGVRAALAARPA